MEKRKRKSETKGEEAERESRCLGATNHVLRRDENGRSWLGPAVARVALQCGIGASTSVEASESKKCIFVFFVCVSLRVSVSVSVCLLVCLLSVCLCLSLSQKGTKSQETLVEARSDTDGQRSSYLEKGAKDFLKLENGQDPVLTLVTRNVDFSCLLKFL